MAKTTRAPPLRSKPGKIISVSGAREGVGGYTWSIALDPKLGRVVSRELHAGDAIGGGATVLFKIELAAKACSGTVRLLLQRPWGGEPAEIIEQPVFCED
jgi:hypothetical protein